MSVVHYKFRSSLEYDSVTFDGLSISLGDLKEAISTQKKLGKNSTDFILQVTNAQTKEEYGDETAQIPKNSSVIVRRIPLANAQPKNKTQLGAEKADMYTSGIPKPVELKDRTLSGPMTSSGFGRGTGVLSSSTAGSEEDRIKAMISQVGEEWNPSKYTYGRGRGFGMTGPLPSNYVCYRCGQPGHYIRNCPTNQGRENKFEPRVKRSTGIPKTWIGEEYVGIDDSKVHSSEHLTTVRPSMKKVPEELQCPMCKKVLADAVLIPCCGTSYCDDCIRNYLLENEQLCPECGSDNVSPDSLVINKHLRQAVKTFNTTVSLVADQPAPSSSVVTTTSKVMPQVDPPKQQVIKSEADSTKNNDISPPKEVAVSGDIVPTSVPSSSSTSVPSSAPSQGINTIGGAPKPNIPPVQHQIEPLFKGDKAQLPSAEGRVIDAPHQIARPRMAVMQNMPVPVSRPMQGMPLHYAPLHKPRPVHMSHHIPPNLPHTIVTSLPVEYGRQIPTHLQAMQPIGPASFPPAHLRPRGHGYSSPGHEIVSGFIPDLGIRNPDIGGRVPPPLSEAEFYRNQRRLKVSKPVEKKKRPSRKRTDPEIHLPTLRHGDFDDELSQYAELQKFMKKDSSRSPSLSSSSSKTRSPDKNSGSFSSFKGSRSVTPEGWDRSRSPTPSPELRKQKRISKETTKKHDKDRSPTRRKRPAKSDHDVPSKKRKVHKEASSSSTNVQKGREPKTVKRGDSDVTKKRRKETSEDQKKGDVSSSKKRSKEHSKGDSKKSKIVTESNVVKNSDSRNSEKNDQSAVKERSEIKVKDSSKKKLKKKHKHKTKKEKGSKTEPDLNESEGITTQDDEDDFDFVQDNIQGNELMEKKELISDFVADENVVDAEKNKQSAIKERTDTKTKDSSKNKLKKKRRSKPKKDKESTTEPDFMESEEGVTTQDDEDDFDFVQDNIQENELIEKKELISDVVADENVVKETVEEMKENVQTEVINSDVKTNVGDEASDIVASGDGNPLEDSLEDGKETLEKGKDTLEESVEDSEHTLEESIEEMQTDETSNMQEVEEETLLSTSASVDSSTENVDSKVEEHEEDIQKEIELEISVLVDGKGRRDSLLDELQSDDEVEADKKEEVGETEAADTKHKKHKKKDKKHKHKKHKKKHKHKKGKKHKKDKGEDASTAESHATQSDSFDEEEDLDFSENSEMEEVFKGPRSVVVPTAPLE